MSGGISVAAVTATYGSALTAGHFWKGPKVTKRPSPHHSAPRLGSVCPNAGFGAWAAAMGHPWPSAANPASCRVAHAPKPAFGQRGLTGRFQIKSKARRPYSRPVGEAGYRKKCGRGLAPDSHGYLHRLVVAAGNHDTKRAALDLALLLISGGPPNPCRITGTPSLSEVPSGGARAFCLLLGFSKVSRCKSGTHSSRYRSNGYVLGLIQHSGRLSGRHREQAPSHIVSRVHPGNGYVLNQEAHYANV